MELNNKEWKNTKDKPNRNVMLSYWTEQNQENKAGTTNSNGTNEGKTLEIKNYRMEIEEKEEGALIEWTCWIFETWRSHSRHLEPWSKISDGLPPLEAHHCSQDKAKEEEDLRLTISL